MHFVQMWIVPDQTGIAPSYQQHDIGDDLSNGALVTIASGINGHDDAAITLHNRSAALHAARLRPGDMVDVPAAPYLHLFVTRGRIDLDGAGELAEGDAVRCTDTGARRLTANCPAEVLVWEMHANLGS
ncbi:putative quercetin 2,3-dioxygenase [Mycobacterium kansasii]|uniref:Putative quercetin 2,3-dioxygenase n=1 Tax=Mycobacterium kansasii TaxID=1768 RepID=A0A1V3WC27_MYCKA|nr:putative quercetin 2,3-dioxygenase [Mycobacterium kansasii]